jgi:Lipocalin-like domain
MNDQQLIVGTWRLVSWENRATDGEISYPMGLDALGYLIYTAEGRFSVTISRGSRPRSPEADLTERTGRPQSSAHGVAPDRRRTHSAACGTCRRSAPTVR